MKTQINYLQAMQVGLTIVMEIQAAATDGVISAEEAVSILGDALQAYQTASGKPLTLAKFSAPEPSDA